MKLEDVPKQCSKCDFLKVFVLDNNDKTYNCTGGRVPMLENGNCDRVGERVKEGPKRRLSDMP